MLTIVEKNSLAELMFLFKIGLSRLKLTSLGITRGGRKGTRVINPEPVKP